MTDSASRFLLGLDVGSTTVKAVAVDARTDAIVWRDYQRHESRPAEKLLELLTRLGTEAGIGRGDARAFITGVGGAAYADLVGAHYVQEVAAVAMAVERHHPDVRTVIELGGQDAKIVVFETEDGRSRKTVSMNDKCAGGTGAVIDKIAAKLKIAPEALALQPYIGLKVYPIAGKCGVFAETDINSLQKRGVAAEELMASLFDAIVLQNLTVLSRGHALPPRVLLVGGPHAFLRGLREAWQTRIPTRWQERGVSLPEGASPESLITTPPLAEYDGALGAVEFARREREASTAYLGAQRLADAIARGPEGIRRGAPAVGVAGMDLAEFRRLYERPAWTPPPLEAGSTIPCFVGLDAGSTSTKAVVLDEGGRVLAKAYQLSRGNPIEDAIEIFASLRQQIQTQGAHANVLGLVTTGYAKDILKDVFAGDAALVETVAHAQSALHVYEDPHVIVDVGGQDIKIIVMHGGRVKDFRLNTACSAGNGYFLQAIARSFGYPVEQFAEAAFSAREMPVFGQGCVLFLQSEIANVQRHGWNPEEILAGLAAVLPKNVFLYVAKAPNLSRFGWRFVLQGGTQRNLSAVKAQVDFIRDSFRGQERQPDIVLHEHCGEAGAIGAGLEAIRMWKHGHQTTFIGLDASQHIRFDTRCDESTRCHFCKNECVRTFIDVTIVDPALAEQVTADVDAVTHRRFVVAGCEKGSAEDVEQMRGIKAAEDAVKKRTPNLVAFAAREILAAAPPGQRGRGDAGPRVVGGRAASADGRRPAREGPDRHPARVQHVRLRPAVHRVPREPWRGPAEHRLLGFHEHRDVPHGRDPGRHRPLFPLEGGARPCAQSPVREAQARAARLHLLSHDRGAAVEGVQPPCLERMPDRLAHPADRSGRLYEGLGPLCRARGAVSGRAAGPGGRLAVSTPDVRHLGAVARRQLDGERARDRGGTVGAGRIREGPAHGGANRARHPRARAPPRHRAARPGLSP